MEYLLLASPLVALLLMLLLQWLEERLMSAPRRKLRISPTDRPLPPLGARATFRRAARPFVRRTLRRLDPRSHGRERGGRNPRKPPG
jgi:hypothetical protein